MKLNKIQIAVGSAAILGIIVIPLVFVSSAINSNKIIPNTYIDDINIGDLTKDEAVKKLEKEYNEKTISIKYNDKSWNILSKDIDFKYNITETVDDAYKYSRDGNFIENASDTISANFGNKTNIKLELNYDKSKLDKKLEEIAKEVDVPAKDATININGSNINVTKEVVGKKVEISDTKKAIENGIIDNNFSIDLVVKEDKPEVTEEQLNSIDTVLGQYSTNFNASVAGRTYNVKLAAQSTSNIVLMPGEEFSYNDSTGPRSIANGYQNAPVIVQGEIQEGVGGGVCQVSTTLYNAVLYSGVDITNFRNHSIPSSYAPKGRDATVAYGAIDFKFKNSFKHPIYIKNTVYGNTVLSQIYGAKADKSNIEIVTTTDKVVASSVKKVNDSNLEVGKEKVTQKGRDAYSVSTYRVYKDGSGKEIKREKVVNSYYPAKQTVISVGTKVPVKKETPKTPEEPKQPEVPKKPEVPKNPEPPKNPEEPKKPDPKPGETEQPKS
jgi:vancomycin resistance protein YoaR